MSDVKKTIMFDQTLGQNNNKTKKKKEKKIKPKPFIKPNTLKKELLQKIKKYQMEEKIKKKEEELPNKSNDDEDLIKFNDDFSKSIEYLNSLKHAKLKSKKNKKTQKKGLQHGGNISQHGGNLSSNNTPFVSNFGSNISSNFSSDNTIVDVNLPQSWGGLEEVSISSPPVVPPAPTISITPANTSVINTSQTVKPIDNTTPLYGCLKGGKKPTYRTLKNKSNISKSLSIETPLPKVQSTRSNELNNIKKKYKKIKQKRRHTKKSTYKLGRNNTKKTISVFIKNNFTRRNVKKEYAQLKQSPINEIKKFLVDKHLLKIGSIAPNDVLRTMYEQAILAGDITNINGDVLLHNYLEDK